MCVTAAKMIMKSAVLLLLASAVLVAADTEERFFLFDVRGDVTAADVLAVVDGFPVEYVFQASNKRFVRVSRVVVVVCEFS